MEYRTLGRSGLKVSPLCLGTMLFGGATEEADARRIVDAAADRGVTFIDSADGYTGGRSEEIVGRAIAARRDSWVLATKFANPVGDGPNGGGTSRKWTMQACEASLKRLGTDYIDLYYLHKEDRSVPLAETVRALADLQRQGKIRYFGVSNYRSWRIAEICRIADDLGVDRPAASQPYYNLVNRMPETEHLPACGYYGLGVFPYSPMARGVLSGKYAPGGAPEAGSRAARGDRRMLETEWRDESLLVAQKMK
ncbi:MAG: aldo/keto reductase, partial [Alphaproteobacteria bacterium]